MEAKDKKINKRQKQQSSEDKQIEQNKYKKAPL